MSGRGGKGGSGGRTLSEAESALWEAVAAAIKPLRRTRLKREAQAAANDVAQKSPDKISRRVKAPPPEPMKLLARAPPPVKPKPALAPLDRRTKHKLSRGREAIDARLDLHGMTQDEAHGALSRFLRRAQADGARFVIVVTGKGLRGGEGSARGVLKREVPRWLVMPEFRDLVVGFEVAAIGHGGEGALYVRVRRLKT